MTLRQFLVGIGISFIALALITTACLLTFSYLLFTDMSELSGMYDVYRYFAPFAFFLDHMIHAGEFPLWNPLSFCGQPTTGNPQLFLFYPPNLVRSILTVNPTPERSNITFAIMWGALFIFMAFCTYLLGRSHKLSFAGALTAAFTLAFSALMIRRMCEYHFITTMAWLPLLLLFVKKMIDAVDFYTKISFAILAGIVMSMSILGGFLQIINMIGLVTGLYGLLYFLITSERHPSQTWRQTLTPWLQNGVAMGVIFLLASLLSAVLLLPTWELGAYSLRTSGQAIGRYSNLWGWSPLDFYQNMIVYPGMKYEAETIRNSGIIALVLVFAGLSHPRRREVFMFMGIFLVIFECSFGPPLPIGALLEKLTPFSISAYTRAYDFASLPLALLAGYGVDAMSKPLSSKGMSFARSIALMLFAFVCLAPLGEWLEEVKFLDVPDLVRTIPLVAMGIIILPGVIHLNKMGRICAGILIVGLLFSETLAWNQSFVPYMTRRKVRDVTEIKHDCAVLPLTNTRESDPIVNRFFYSLRFAMNGYDPLHIAAVRDLISGPPRDRPGYRSVKDWEPTKENLRGNLLFKRSFWLARHYSVGALPGKRVPYPAATTVFLEEEQDIPVPLVERQRLGLSSISDAAQTAEITAPANLFAPVPGGQKSVLAFTADLPTSSAARPAGPAGALHSALVYHYKSNANVVIEVTFTQPGTDRSEMGIRHTLRPTGNREAQLEVPMPDFPTVQARIAVENKGPGDFTFTRLWISSDLNDEDGLINILARTANTVDLNIGPLEDYRILTFLDAYYPGWKAYLNGQEVPILRANEQFKAIVVPPGSHEVRFAFKPALTMRAMAISLTTLTLALVGLIVCWFLRMPGVSENPSDMFSVEIAYGPGRSQYSPVIIRTQRPYTTG